MPNPSLCASSRRSEPMPNWTDLADLLDDIRSPQRDEVEAVIRTVCGDAIGAATVRRIADAVIGLYRRQHKQD